MRPECGIACERYRLALPDRALAGRAGERLGRGTGSSLEFMDYRDYVAGDDLRHIDWRGYARTDRLAVRLYREEISPLLEIVVDTSTSMAVSEQKATATRDLVDAVGAWARKSGGQSRRLACAGGVLEDGDSLAFDRDDGGLRPRAGLRPRTLRVLISDFLFQIDPGPELRALSAGAAHLYVLQLLDPWELAPQAAGPHTLIDCEGDAQLDLDLSERTVAAYAKRLRRLRDGVARAARSCGGTYACVEAAEPEVMFRQHLLPQGVLEPAR